MNSNDNDNNNNDGNMVGEWRMEEGRDKATSNPLTPSKPTHITTNSPSNTFPSTFFHNKKQQYYLAGSNNEMILL